MPVCCESAGGVSRRSPVSTRSFSSSWRGATGPMLSTGWDAGASSLENEDRMLET
jgi:hypothetical protein